VIAETVPATWLPWPQPSSKTFSVPCGAATTGESCRSSWPMKYPESMMQTVHEPICDPAASRFASTALMPHGVVSPPLVEFVHASG